MSPLIVSICARLKYSIGFLNHQMSSALGDKFTAHVFTYNPARLRSDLTAAVALFENLLSM